MTFNIRTGKAREGENHWDKRKEMVFDLIRRHSPDLVGLQEAQRFQIDEIRNTLPEYAEIGAARRSGTEGECWLFTEVRLELKKRAGYRSFLKPLAKGRKTDDNQLSLPYSRNLRLPAERFVDQRQSRRVQQQNHQAYGYRDEEYLHLQIYDLPHLTTRRYL